MRAAASRHIRQAIEHDLFGKPLHTFPDHALKRYEIRLNHNRALALLSMIFSENRCTLFRIML
jgi:hypothetical protein